MMPDLKSILAELHYDALWLDYGWLSEDFWQHQYARYQSSDDKNTEHYRYEAFQTIFMNRERLDETTLNHYIELANADADRSMGGAALGLLLSWPGLTDTQLQHLSNHPAYDRPFLRKLGQRMILLRELRAIGISDESFERFLASQDAEVQRALLSDSGLKPEQLRLLQDKGATRAIRNMAKRKLQSS
jgi:hypothetical protein